MENFIVKNNIDASNVKKLSGGLSNEIYLIDNKYIWKKIKNNYLFDHMNEIEIIKNANNIKLYYFDKSNICYSYIKGDNITLKYYRDNLGNIIKLTKEYNSYDLNVPNFWNDIIPNWIKLLPNESGSMCFDKIKEFYNYKT